MKFSSFAKPAKFRQASETGFDGFCIRLRQLVSSCDFHDVDQEIRIQLIQGFESARIRRHALYKDCTLNELIKAAHSMEAADVQANEIEEKDPSIKRVYESRPRQNPSANAGNDARFQGPCRWCGNRNAHPRETCQGVPVLPQAWAFSVRMQIELNVSQQEPVPFYCGKTGRRARSGGKRRYFRHRLRIRSVNPNQNSNSERRTTGFS